MAATYTVQISNSFGSGAGRNYCVFSATPEVTGGGIQPSDVLVLVCHVVGPIENTARKSFTYCPSYFGFAGRIREGSGGKVVEAESDHKVDLGGDTTNNGTCLDARVPERGGLSIQPASPADNKGPKGSFTIRCLSKLDEPHDVMVGLALMMNGDSKSGVPIAAVPYRHGVEYTIKPQVLIRIIRENMEVGQVISQDVVSKGFSVRFQGTQVKAKIREDNMGGFFVSGTTFGFGSNLSTGCVPLVYLTRFFHSS
jgi:hypothetical protein